jgi:glycyl-tRNA synthetase
MAENKEIGIGLLEKIISLTKRRGFIYQGSELYGGLAGTWDYGPLGVALKNNLKKIWWQTFVDGRDDMYGLDAAIIMNPAVWKASGHVETFTDPLIECEKCKRRFRADHLEDKTKCPECGGRLSEPRRFNMMFRTQVGAVEDSSGLAYLRPETAQGIFVNFKNIIDSFHPKLPFGIGQIGKAFRNEITPKDFIFRVREFEQMEIEYFVRPGDWEAAFEEWRKSIWSFLKELGFSEKEVSELNVPAEDLAHYSKRTIDFEFEFPFGKSELLGMAYRTDYDLTQHAKESGTELAYLDEESKEKFVPHVIEPSFGLDRLILAIFCQLYREDEMNGENRTYLKLPYALSPIKVAVFPLLKNKPELVEKARQVYSQIKAVVPQAAFDDNGNIGKRYRRQDEIGTPYCVTIDFDTLTDDTVTLRDRDSGEQTRIKIGADLVGRVSK